MTSADTYAGEPGSAWLARLGMHLLLLGIVTGITAGLLALARPRQATDAAPAVERSGASLSSQASGRGAVSSAPFAAADALSLALETPQDAAASPALPLAGQGYLLKAPQLQTIIPKRPRKDLIAYSVAEGDNLSTIAARFDIDVDTLIWANDKLEEDPDYLVVGQKLVVPPVSGVLHTVKVTDTLEIIAKQFKGDVRTMLELEYNNLSAASMPVSGTKIMVPGGEKPYQPRLVYIDGRAVMVNAPRGGGRFVWPAQGWITQYWNVEHRALDVGAPLGTPVYASDSGVVISSGWMGDYGYAVIIDHGNGFQTLYSHLSTYYPQPGQNIRRGQAIGKMGSTGKSTGPHLHFEIRYLGGNVNPMRYLP